ncbi:MAG TPA: ATP-binding cassette domain-containing protein [Spirochaetia bacterium]|nr:ATP-binding cassette domain-containing protein [Spirochaetia bacterium]
MDRRNGKEALELESVCLDIEGRQILKDITWRVGRGEKWIILGRNGSGKTSLLRLLSGFGFPSRGRMRVLGELLGRTDLHLLRRKIGWIHGDLAADIPVFMTALEVVLSGAEGSLVVYQEVPQTEEAMALRMLETLGMMDFAGRRFFRLSTGERQRVLIARALASGPELLLLDEPCQGLDPRAREEFLESLAGLLAARPDLSVVSVTHHVDEIIDGFTRVLVLEDGGVLAGGERDEVLTPVMVKRLFGERCRLHSRGGRYFLSFGKE